MSDLWPEQGDRKLTDLTDLDHAHATMEASPDDDAARLRFFERLADSELFLVLEDEAEGDVIRPGLFDVEGERFALVFDREARLAEFAGQVTPTAALSGRALVALLDGQGIGLALNPDVAPSAMLIAAQAVEWLAQTLRQGPVAAMARPVEVAAPVGLPEALIRGLDRKLALAGALAEAAYLVAVTYDDGSRGHMLAFVGARAGAEQALATAAGEALTFSGIEAGVMDVTFVAPDDPITARLARVGLRFDLPLTVPVAAPGAPGMDPDRPPRLR